MLPWTGFYPRGNQDPVSPSQGFFRNWTDAQNSCRVCQPVLRCFVAFRGIRFHPLRATNVTSLRERAHTRKTHTRAPLVTDSASSPVAIYFPFGNLMVLTWMQMSYHWISCFSIATHVPFTCSAEASTSGKISVFFSVHQLSPSLRPPAKEWHKWKH